jgi:peptide/nickel transport system permease protein
MIETKAQGRSIGRLIWRRFRKNRLGVIGGVVVALLFGIAIIAPFLATMEVGEQSAKHILAPPQRIYARTEDGNWSRPFVYNLVKSRDPDTLRLIYTEDRSRQFPIRLFAEGFEYRILWLITGNIHLFGVDKECRWNLLGTDPLGRDLHSRILMGSQVSLSVPLVGVSFAIFIGTVIGVISGYCGGRVDHYIQRLIEIMMSFPTLPLWLALAAAIPITLPSAYRYLLIVVILSLIDWGGLARAVRGKVLQYRDEDYVLAARMSGCGLGRIVFKHLVPGTLSHLIVCATLAVPGMILAESALSFLGIGITPPLTSWGMLLKDAHKLEVLVYHQWITLPGFLIIIAVLSFNFLGDGLRDAADPYS